LDLRHELVPCGGGLEYLHRSLARLRGRRKGNTVPGGKLGYPFTVRHKYRDLALQFGGLNARLSTLLYKKIAVAKSKRSGNQMV
jgi:hypothetical protein